MLQSLTICNIVLIQQCQLDLSAGLCVLTGETGAGKSILLDALGLVLGNRSDARLLRHGEDQASVTAEFDITGNKEAKRILSELDIDMADEVILRRTLSSDGKSNCFINDQKVSAAAMKQLGEALVEINGQHDQKGLLDATTHQSLLDAYGELIPTRSKVAEAHATWKETQKKLDEFRELIAKAAQEEEYLRYMVNELSQLHPEVGEEEQLADKRTKMMQAERLAETLNDAISELSGANPVEQSLRTAHRSLSRNTLAGNAFIPIVEMLDRAMSEVQEAIAALEAIGRESSYNEAELDRIEERLFALRAAARKYNLPVDELVTLRKQAEEKLTTITHQHEEQAKLEAAESKAKETYRKLAETLTEARKKTAASLEKAVSKELTPLKMGGTLFRVGIMPLPESAWSARGMDAIAFEAVTNAVKGMDIPFQPLHRIASGGELSRFMLALKVALAKVKSTPTLIFDEVDTGTGGAVADAIGQRLAMLGEQAQVLVVTHLPQVAARGATHLRVNKTTKAKTVETTVENLSIKERREELARMLAGAEVTSEARSAASKLLEAAG